MDLRKISSRWRHVRAPSAPGCSSRMLGETQFSRRGPPRLRAPPEAHHEAIRRAQAPAAQTPPIGRTTPSEDRSIGSGPKPRGRRGIELLHERGRNNQAKNSHQPTRRRERKRQRFKSVHSAQKLLSTHAAVFNTFNVRRHLSSAQTHRTLRTAVMGTWREVVAGD
jgi:hypothetical protein